jgi:hypothetical protein
MSENCERVKKEELEKKVKKDLEELDEFLKGILKKI